MQDTEDMIIDGKGIAQDMRKELCAETEGRRGKPTLHIFVVGENPVIDSFVRIKKRFGDSIGVRVVEKRFEDGVGAGELKQEIARVARHKNVGIVVQLPLPKSVDAQEVLDAIPTANDVDVLSRASFEAFRNGSSKVLPPVVGAVKEILERAHVPVSGKRVVIIGRGILVGMPAEIWFKREGARVDVLNSKTEHPERFTTAADIILSGAGVPGLVREDMVREGAALFDAGTSSEAGRLTGDIDSACAHKASVFTPVPGGIGPVTVAILFGNVLELTKENRV